MEVAARVASPTDKNRILHFSPAETLRLMRDMESPSPDLRNRVNPFFARQIQAGSNTRGRMSYFKSNLDANSELDVQAMRYGLADPKKKNKFFVNPLTGDDDGTSQPLKDPLQVKAYGNNAAGTKYFNPSQYGEGSKNHEEPFIFETRVGSHNFNYTLTNFDI